MPATNLQALFNEALARAYQGEVIELFSALAVDWIVEADRDGALRRFTASVADVNAAYEAAQRERIP